MENVTYFVNKKNIWINSFFFFLKKKEKWNYCWKIFFLPSFVLLLKTCLFIYFLIWISRFLHGAAFICCQVKQHKNSHFLPSFASIILNAMICNSSCSLLDLGTDKKREVRQAKNIITCVAFQSVPPSVFVVTIHRHL